MTGRGDEEACTPRVQHEPWKNRTVMGGSPDAIWWTKQIQWWRILQVESHARSHSSMTTLPTIHDDGEGNEHREGRMSKVDSHESAIDGRAPPSKRCSSAHSSLTASVDAYTSVGVIVTSTDEEEERGFIPTTIEEGGKEGVQQRMGRVHIARFSSVRSSEEEMYVTNALRSLHLSIATFRSRSPPAAVSVPSAGGRTCGQGKPACSLVSLVVFTASTFQRCVALSTGAHAARSTRSTATTISDPHPSSSSSSSPTTSLRDVSPSTPRPEPRTEHATMPTSAMQAESSRRFSSGKERITAPAGSLHSPITVDYSPAAAATTLLHVFGQDVMQKELRQLVWGVLRLQHRYLQDVGKELSELLDTVQASESTVPVASPPFAPVSPPRSPFDTLQHSFLLSSVAPSSWSMCLKDWLCFSKSMIHVLPRPRVDATTREASERGEAIRSAGNRCSEVDASSSSPPPLGVLGKDEEKTRTKEPFSVHDSFSSPHTFPYMDGPIYPRVEVCTAHHVHHFHYFFSSSLGVVEQTAPLPSTAPPPSPLRTSSSSSSSSLASIRVQNEVGFSAWMGRPATSILYALKKEHETQEKNEKKDGGGGEGAGISFSHSNRPPAQCPPQGREVNGPFPVAEAIAILRRMTNALSFPVPVAHPTLDTVPPPPHVAAVRHDSPRMRQALISCARSTLWTFLFEVTQFRIALAYFLQMEKLLQEVKTVTTLWKNMETSNLSSPSTIHATKGVDGISSVHAMPSLFFLKVEESQLQLVDKLLRFTNVTSDETSRILDVSRHWTRFYRMAQLHDVALDERRMGAAASVGKERDPFLVTSLSSEHAHPSTLTSSLKDTPDGSVNCSYSTVEEIFKRVVDVCKERREEYLQRYSDPHRFDIHSASFKKE